SDCRASTADSPPVTNKSRGKPAHRSQAGGPDGEAGVALVVGGRATADGCRGEHLGLAEVLGDDGAAVVVAGVEPAADGLGGEDAVAERADEAAVRPQYPGHIAEHIDGPGEIVDGRATHDVVHGLVAEWD